MKDKEVGDLFKQVQPGQEFAHLNPIVIPLIYKLIDERKNRLYVYGEPLLDIEQRALSDFGITEEEWGNRVPLKS